jgi:hypothetical protein
MADAVRQVQLYLSRDDRLMADMLATYLVNSATSPDGRVAGAEDGHRARRRASP